MCKHLLLNKVVWNISSSFSLLLFRHVSIFFLRLSFLSLKNNKDCGVHWCWLMKNVNKKAAAASKNTENMKPMGRKVVAKR